MVNENYYRGSIVEVCLDGKTAKIPIYDIFDKKVPTVKVDAAFLPAINRQVMKPDVSNEEAGFAACWNCEDGKTDCVFDAAMRIVFYKHVLHMDYPMITDGNSYIRLCCRMTDSSDGSLFSHDLLLMQADKTVIDSVYRKVVNAFFENVESPVAQFSLNAKKGLYNDMSDEAYQMKLQHVKREALNWHGKPFASVLGLTIDYGADLLLHDGDTVALRQIIFS